MLLLVAGHQSFERHRIVSYFIASFPIRQFIDAKRAAMIRRKAPGPYEDTVGPTVLGIMVMISIVCQFALKLYSMTK
jgi:hypothetical protein